MGDLSGSEEDSMGQDGELHIHQVGCIENLAVWFDPHKVCWSIHGPQQTADFLLLVCLLQNPSTKIKTPISSPDQRKVLFME